MKVQDNDLGRRLRLDKKVGAEKSFFDLKKIRVNCEKYRLTQVLGRNLAKKKFI